MSFFTKIRDTVENAGAAMGNVFTGGLANTGKLTSTSAQQSGLGQFVKTASGMIAPIAGGVIGSIYGGPVGGMVGSRVGGMLGSYGGFGPSMPSPIAQAGIGAGIGMLGGAGGSGGGAGGVGGVGGIGSGLGGILGAGLNASAMNEMKQAYAQAQDDAQRAGQFTPYNVYAGTGSTSYDPATGSMRSSLDPAYQGLRTSLLGNAQGGLNALSTYDPNAMATQTYNQMQAMAAPGEAADRANLTAQIQQTGQTGLAMGGDPNNPDPAMQAAYNPQMAALLRSQSQASQARQLSAINQSQDIANQMQARATGQLGAGFQLDQSQLANMQLGGQLGSQAMQGRLAGSRLAQPAIIGQGAAKAGLLGGIGSSLGLPGMGGAGGGIPGMGGALGSGLSNMFGGGGINLGNLWRSNPGSGTIPGSMQDINSNYDNYLYGDPSLNYGGGVGYGTTPMLPDYTGGGTFGGDISGGVGDFGSSNFIPGMGGGSDFGGGGFTDFAAGPYTF